MYVCREYSLSLIHIYQSPNNFQLTGTWYVNFCRNLLTFSGFADWWREETNYGKTIFLECTGQDPASGFSDVLR